MYLDIQVVTYNEGVDRYKPYMNNEKVEKVEYLMVDLSRQRQSYLRFTPNILVHIGQAARDKNKMRRELEKRR